jgi:ubiquinone/menaquinone biosynthesis C-methylase UbiE
MSQYEFRTSCGCDFLVDNKTAEKFSTYMKKFIELYTALSKIVQNHTGTPHPFIVDLGCGPGLLSLEILKQISDATVIGVDPLKNMLSLAQENIKQSNGKSFVPLLGISEKIPLRDACVDTIVSRFSLAYWKHPDESFLEMHRVLKPGGKIILEALNRDFPKWKLFCIKMGMLVKQAGQDVIRYHVDAYELAYTMEKVENLLKNAGFSIIEKEGKKNEWKFNLIAEKQ